MFTFGKLRQHRCCLASIVQTLQWPCQMWGYLLDRSVGSLLVDGLAMYGVDLCRLDEDGGVLFRGCVAGLLLG